MENQELRTKIDGLKGTLVQVMDEGFDIAKSFLSIKLEEYLTGKTGMNSSSKGSRSAAMMADTDEDLGGEVSGAEFAPEKKSSRGSKSSSTKARARRH